MERSYEDGIKAGRRQIIANLRKHYDEMYFSEPLSYVSGCDIGVCLPETTLYKYFKELNFRVIKEE